MDEDRLKKVKSTKASKAPAPKGIKKIAINHILEEPTSDIEIPEVVVETVPDPIVDTIEAEEAAEEAVKEQIIVIPDTDIDIEKPIPPSDIELTTDNTALPEPNIPETTENEIDLDSLHDTDTPTPDAELAEMLQGIESDDSDKLVKLEDKVLEHDFALPEQRRRSPGRFIKDGLVLWWNNPIARYGTLLLLVLGVGITAALPVARYSILNMVGVRAKASMSIIDDKNNQPLRNVDVTIEDITTKTNSEGIATFSGLKLGKTIVTIKKTAFEARTTTVTIGWGSNPLEQIRLDPTGSRFSFTLSDWLSLDSLPQGAAEISYKDSIVTNDAKGLADLTIEPTDSSRIEITIKAQHYQDIKYSVDTTNKKTNDIKMVSTDRHYFMSKRSGKYDLYSSYLDGKDQRLILAGTGSERDDLVVSINPEATLLALVSTRDGERNKDGYVKSSLNLIDLTDKAYSVKKVANSERVQLVGWYGTRLIYVRVADGASATNPNRHRLITYDTTGGGETEIAASNYFNDVLATREYVFYAPSNAYQENPQPYMFRVKPDGTDKQKMLDKEVWNIFRLDYDTLVVAFQQDWYSVDINTKVTRKLDGQPTNLTSRLFAEDIKNKTALRNEERDGKGTLLQYDKAKKTETVLLSQSGLGEPISYIRDQYIVYRVNTPGETADYVMPITGTKGAKISDVSKTGSIDRWYYY